jgi:hypothetical protein
MPVPVAYQNPSPSMLPGPSSIHLLEFPPASCPYEQTHLTIPSSLLAPTFYCINHPKSHRIGLRHKESNTRRPRPYDASSWPLIANLACRGRSAFRYPSAKPPLLFIRQLVDSPPTTPLLLYLFYQYTSIQDVRRRNGPRLEALQPPAVVRSPPFQSSSPH